MDGSAPGVRRHAARLTGAKVTGVRTVGKNLLVDTDGGLTIHIHLGMNGRVVTRPAGAHAPGNARIAIATSAGVVVVTGTNQVEVDRRERLDAVLGRLGPDLGADPVDFSRIGELSRRYPNDASISEFLLDQRVMAGIGNEYKSEVLFLEGIDPRRSVGSVSPRHRLALARRAHRLLAVNLGDGPRTTTGGRAGSKWVYDRAGSPCRRCRSAIESGWVGEPPRITYWCPRCQT